MGFEFPLQSLLRFRENMERREWLLLQGTNQRIAQVRQQIAELKTLKQETKRRRRLSLENGVRASELQFEVSCDRAIARREMELIHKCDELQKERDHQQKVFQHARQEREVLENIRDRQYALYLQERGRREQKMLDELFLIRCTRTTG